MSTVIEARRLNGTDLGKSIDDYGAIESVMHLTKQFMHKTPGVRGVTITKAKAVQVVTSRGTFIFEPSHKITITGKPSPKEASNV